MRSRYLRTRPLISLFGWLLLSIAGCAEEVPPERVRALETLEAELRAVQGAEYAPERYVRFVTDWVALRGRIEAEEDTIRWPWENHPLLAEVERVQAEGQRALEESQARREAVRLQTQAQLASLEGRFRAFNSRIDQLGTRIVLGRKPVETSLLLHQARSFYEQGQYTRSAQLARQAAGLMSSQATVLTAELGHYGDERRVGLWRRMVQRTIEWSRSHRAAAIVISKADHRLILYRNGRPVVSYPVTLGYNGMLEKRYQGDGATPEGQYHIIRKRDRGQTQFFKALLLDYPNDEDRRRFEQARRNGRLPRHAYIGGLIEIHGGDDVALSQTLGCVMLENADIDRLFKDVEVGTPVTIVGALEVSNTVSLALAGLDRSEEG
ncbi:L,D-transpeptidase family protein [Candidatus Nitrospira bockiana]